MATAEESTQHSVSVWDVPIGAEVNVGWRHVVILLVTVGIGSVVGGLGTMSFPVGDTPSGFAPSAAVQVVAGIWFGGWGVLAGVIFPAIVRSLAGPDNVLGRVLADIVLCGLPAIWFRFSRPDPGLSQRGDRLMYLLVVVIIANLLAAMIGVSYLMIVEIEGRGLGRWLARVLAWFAAGAGPCLVLGLPILRTLSPVITRSSLFCRSWWQSVANVGPAIRRFRHQPIIVKIMVGLSAAGFLPLLFVMAVGLWDDYRQAMRQAVDMQRQLTEQIENDLEKILSGHEQLLERYAKRLTKSQAVESFETESPVLSPLFPSVMADVQRVPTELILSLIDNDQAKALESGQMILTIGPGAPPKRSEAVNLMRLVATGKDASIVLVDSIDLSELEKAVFDATLARGHEYALATASGRQFLRSANFHRSQSSHNEGTFTESVEGSTLLYYRHSLQTTGWILELMIPQASGVKWALAQRRGSTHDYTPGITSLALFVALAVGGYLARTLEQPVRDLTRTVRQAGRLDVEVEAVVHGHDEIGELAASFNEMSRQLRRSIAALERTTAEKERLSFEFELAADLQRRILPVRPPMVPGFDIAGLCEPAREVGGDFFDWQMLSEIRLGLLIGDACGKGMGAAFLINQARSVALAHLQDSSAAGAVLRRTNNTLFQSRTMEDAFTTMFCMILSVPSRRLDYASAGHPPAILYRPATREMMALDSAGRPLGLDLENPIESGDATLMVGDVLVAFTDGVLDASNPAGEQFGRARLEQTVRDHANLGAAELALCIKQEVLAFCDSAAQFDDLTVLVVRAIENDDSTAINS